LTDTNVLLDLFTADPTWAGWSMARLDRAALKGPLVMEALDAALRQGGISVAAMPRAAVTRVRLLSRDARRYRRYFPAVELVMP